MDEQELQRLQKRSQRERLARKEAEALLEAKSLDLYTANQALQKLADQLEARVAQRTQQLEAALDASQAATRAKSSFLAIMGHEIRTPLNGILGIAQLLERSPLNADQASMLATLSRCGDSLLTLINEILDYSKLEASQMMLESTPVNLPELLHDIVKLYQPIASKKQLSLTLEINNNVEQWIKSDPLRLRQILQNLLGNAIKFTEHGYVSILAEQSQQTLTLKISDSGIGIRQEQINSLFKPFSQADSTITRQYGGTGLGLAIVSRIIELMGGDIQLTSEYGSGSIFLIHLPLQSSDSTTPTRSSKAIPTQLPPDLHVLIAEDNAVNQFVAQRCIEQAGARATVVDNGEAALQMLKIIRFPVVLMDLSMPILDGLSACRAIRAQPECYGQPWIIALTANSLIDDRCACLEAGMDDFIAKPFNFEQIQAAISRAITKVPTAPQASKK
ncbi:ATP-binding protein [Iodobacter sp. CM08]|uniref:ATP-binding protein n=1 Tax=Iodobacter sp. CM08 TaxID=3085902 RepID=UPI0029825DBF|nr:ATP-binding protein [Iodobacter sp. CM08]MDW5418323.1 ATP-binding protein [Iodobacter sp. CM08]